MDVGAQLQLAAVVIVSETSRPLNSRSGEPKPPWRALKQAVGRRSPVAGRVILFALAALDVVRRKCASQPQSVVASSGSAGRDPKRA